MIKFKKFGFNTCAAFKSKNSYKTRRQHKVINFQTVACYDFDFATWNISSTNLCSRGHKFKFSWWKIFFNSTINIFQCREKIEEHLNYDPINTLLRYKKKRQKSHKSRSCRFLLQNFVVEIYCQLKNINLISVM